MNYKMIFRTLGMTLLFEACSFLLPIICALCYGENTILPFVICIVISAAAGGLLMIPKPKNRTIYAKEGFTIVALSWIVISLIGALPFTVSRCIPNYVDAVFETVSGFTTTGASILTDVEALPKSMLFWRSFTHWIGGMGVLVFLVAVLPMSGGDNLYLIKAESPGPSVSKLVPKVRTTAKLLYLMYLGITGLEVVLLLFGGLNLFEALTLTFGTVGTGGFAILNSGLSTYSSYVQIVITVFMIMCGVDFSIYYLIINRKYKDAFRSDEVRTYLAIILVSIVLISINCLHMFSNYGESLKHSAFQVGSIITTTGYSTVDFDLWPSFSKTILVALMFCGACAGSTGGGIKVSRLIILFKSIIKQVKITAHPKRTYKINVNGRALEHETLRAVNVYMAAYIAIFTVSLLIVSLDNFDFTTNFTGVAATINNIGPGLAMVGPTSNFSSFSILSKIVYTVDMLIGRLEIFPILLLFAPTTWRKS